VVQPGFQFLSLAVALLWGIALLWFLLKGRHQPTLNLISDTSEALGKVSVIVPARNEANRVLVECIESLLAQNYPDFEVIVVDDRSTDGTLGILESISVEHNQNRLKIVQGRDLPEDWLGKPHALQQGLDVSSGEIILTTDSDIVFHRDALLTSVAYLNSKRLDVLSLVPRLQLETFWERVFMPVFGWFCLIAMPLEKVNDPNKKETIGVGNFFLLRRAALDVIGGFAAVKRDVAEDLRLAELVKEKRLSLMVETAPDLISTRMYYGLDEIWDGFTKNLFSALKFSTVKGLFGAISIFVFGFLPILLVGVTLIMGNPLASTLFAISYLIQVSIFSAIIKSIEQNPIYSLFIPLGFGVYALILLNSMFRILSGKGVTWKGRNIYEKGGMKPPTDPNGRRSI
jgi:chlorobactene glucosyltransferase